jgi:hypothetical protein
MRERDMKSIHRCMVCVAGASLVCSGLLAAPAQAQERPTKAELRYQALNVFQRHCLKCHGGDAPKGGLRILDHTLLVEQRQVIRPRFPETSELFDLVQGGSMPPGNCRKVPEEELAFLKEWIQAGAEALPSTHEEPYVLWSIVRDLRSRTDEQKRSIRYLSLNHLLAPDRTLGNLAEQRENLELVFRELVPQGKQPPNLLSLSIEPTNTVFRIDLKDLGWDRHPYSQADKRWRNLNLFDLILLEYPHGRLPTHSPFYPELLQFLLVVQEAGQVRPIPYLRGDWVAEAIRPPRSPLRVDFLHVLDKPIRGDSPRPDPEAVAGAAEGRARGASVDGPSQPAKPFLAMPLRLPRGGADKVHRAILERLADALDGDANGGVPIVPLDGLTYVPKPNPDVQLRAIDFQQRNLANPPAQDLFAPGDRMALWIKTKWNSVAEMIKTDLKSASKSKPQFDDRETFECKGGEAKVWSGEMGIRMQLSPKEEQDSEEFTIYAYPVDDLKAANAEFPKGTLLRAEGIHDRVVHPLYKLRANGRGFEPPDAGKMFKVTITLTTKRKTD